MTEVVWERRECVSAQVEDALVLLDLETLVYHSLNGTASAVWELLNEPRNERFLVEALCERYNVEPEHCRDSVSRLMQRLAQGTLVRAREQV